MAWLGESLSSLSSLKGQITSFTKEVLSDGIVNEINDSHTKNLEEANAKCNQLQELLNSKEAEISILRKQNSELQKAVVEFRSKPNESTNGAQDAESDAFFWDPQPQSSKNQESKNQTKVLLDQLDQATVKIQDLESELHRLRTLNPSNIKDVANFKEEGPSQKTETLRAKQDVMNRIIQIGEMSREVERNTKRLQQNKQSLVDDFRMAISKLASAEQHELIRSALLALENEKQEIYKSGEKEKSDSDVEVKSEKEQKLDENEQERELRRRIEELKAENQNLMASMEELDRQSSESIEHVLLLKEELQKKHHSLQNAYEHLYVEYNQAVGKVEDLQQQQQQQQQQQHESELAKSSVKESLNSAVQTFTPIKLNKETETVWSKKDKETETVLSNEDKGTEVSFDKEDQETKSECQLDASVELEKVQEILKHSTITIPTSDGAENDSLFVNLAKNLAELKWKQETLEHKFTNQSRELKETQELRDTLQLDCEDMQANIESLLVEIQHLKSNLPSIPEASEERVASLETETELLQEEIRSLRKANADMSQELKAIKEAIKESEVEIDVDRIEALLAIKPINSEVKDSAEMLRAALDENTELRRRIDVLESELRVSLERCKGIDENLELIEELKLDLENARRELKILTSTNKRLENSLIILQEAKNEVDADNEVLASQKEQFEADLKLLQESDLKRDNGEALAELRNQLIKAREEKDDLEYDIMKMRQELDKTLEESEVLKTKEEELQADNERLIQENNKLMDHFTETHNESHEKIELLNTEMTLLQQELDGCRKELEKAVKSCVLAEEKVLMLEKENKRLIENSSKVEDLEGDNARLTEALEISKRDLAIVTDKLKTLEEKVLILDDENSSKVEDLKGDNAQLTEALEISKRDLAIVTDKLKTLEEKVLILDDENMKLRSELTSASNFENENQRLIQAINEKQREILKNQEEIVTLETKLESAESYTSTLESKQKFLEDTLTQLKIQVEESGNLKKEVISQQESEMKMKEIESSVHREVAARHQVELDKLINLEEENEKLKIELNRLLVEKRDSQANVSNVPSLYSDNSQLLMDLAKKSEEVEKLNATIAKDKESAAMARETVENLSQLISAKDGEVSKLNASYALLSEERDKLVKLVQEKHAESLQYHTEIQRLTQLLNEHSVNLQRIVAERDANVALFQEKQTELLWTQNEMQVLKQRLQNVEEMNNHAEHCGIPEHTLLSKQTSVLEEKNKALEAAIIQDQTNIRYLQEQLTEAQSKETAALKEVERLRNHLVEIESNYTEEALQSEEIRNTLEAKLMQVEEKLKNSSTIYTSASIRANQQVETLQQQLALIVQQRDDLQNKISAAEDKVHSYSASLTNLQLVLEQFQRDKEKDIYAATEKLRSQLQESYVEQQKLRNDIENLKAELMEAKDALQAASRLTEELERKSQRIEQLNQEVNKLTELVNSADERIEEANKSGEEKVDKTLIKNLLLGYISSPTNDKTSVLRVCANVLDFNETEREKSGLNDESAKSSWFGFLASGGSTPSKEQETSLSTAFIRFLENESQPKPQLPALPISNSSINRSRHNRQDSQSSTQSFPWLTNVNLPTFPEFVPARNTGSILKEVLKDS